MPKEHCHKRQKGFILPLLAVGMLAIIGIVGMSIDLGHVFLNKTRLQNSLDSAALSAARTLMLSGDVTAASRDARQVFTKHLDGEMAKLSAGNLVMQFSQTLVPFVPSESEPRYVRVAFRSFDTGMYFSSVLPGVESSMSVGGSAVAGPIPVGYPGSGETCDIAPLLMCGLPGDTDCTDGSCFDYQIYPQREYRFELLPSVAASAESSTAQSKKFQSPDCGEGSHFYNCISWSKRSGKKSNRFAITSLDCSGEDCIRENLAGAYDSCLTQNDTVGKEAGSTLKPVLQGLSTRFGVYPHSLSEAKYPHDVVLTDRSVNIDSWYHTYKRDVDAVIVAGASSIGGTPYRRVLTVPIVNCNDEATAQDAHAILGFACFFLTRKTKDLDNYIFGQFVNECEASGEQNSFVPKLTDKYHGPTKTVLYKDPDSYES